MFRLLVNLRISNILNGQKRRIILRKLDEKERSILTRRFDESYVFKLKITSRIDLFKEENLNYLKQSIMLWKKSHPFLNCKIKRVITSKANSEYYFDLVENTTNDNVKFLRFDGNENGRIVDDVSDLILYEHLARPLRIDQSQNESDLLWRISIFQRNSSSPFEYDVMFDVHHTIAQARNSYLTLMQLFQVFEDIFERRETTSLKPSQVYLGAETVFDRIRKRASKESRQNVPVIRIPQFMRANRSTKHKHLDTISGRLETMLQGKLIDVESGLECESIKDLYEIKKNYHRRHRTFFLDQDLLSSALKKCKKEGVKFGMFIQMIISRSLIDLYRNHGHLNDEEQLENIVYYAPVCLRRYCNLDEYIMGYCVGGMISVLSKSDINDLQTEFWSAVRRNGEIYQNRLEKDNEKFFLRMREIDESCGEMNFHFSTSNMMSFEGNEATKGNMIRARECFWVSSGVPEKNNRLFLSTFCTLGGRINWMIVFNSEFIREDLIDELSGLIQHNINTILIE